MVRSREPLCCRCACRGSTRVVGSTAVRSKNRNTKPPGQGGKQLQARTQFSTLRSLLSAEKISLDCPTPNAINFSRASRKISIAAPNYGCTSTVPYGTLMTYTPPRSIGVAAGLHLDRDVMVCLSVCHYRSRRCLQSEIPHSTTSISIFLLHVVRPIPTTVHNNL